MAGFVPAAVRRLRNTHPDLRVLLSEVTADTLEPRLLGGEFDVALAYQDAAIARREIHDTQRIDLFRDTFLLGLPPDHRLAQATRPIRLADLAEDDWVLPSTEGFLIESCRQAGFEPNIVAISQDPVATRGIIARGLAIGWVPGLLVDDYTGVKIQPIDGPNSKRDIYALLPPGDTHPLAAHIINALRETANDFNARADAGRRTKPAGKQAAGRRGHHQP
jgi:DNA-binding transcriptional LysR family regulator